MNTRPSLSRRSFLQRSAAAGVAWTAPLVVPGRVLGRGAPAPSERITLGVHRLRRAVRGDPAPLPDVRRRAVRRRVGLPGQPAGRGQAGRGCPQRQPGLRHPCRLPRVPGPPGHRRRADRHRRPLAHAAVDPGRQVGQGHLLREAGLADHRRGPGPGRHDGPLRHGLPDRPPAPLRGLLRVSRSRRPAAG